MTRLSRIVLLLRDVKHGIKFYGHGLGLKVDTMTEEFARLTTSEGLAVELNRAET